MAESAWAILGLPGPVADAAAVRRAYAARLKQLRADTDPAAFMRLRAAYETALAQARRGVTAGADSPVPGPEPAVAADPPTAGAAALAARSPGAAAHHLRHLEQRLGRARHRAIERAVERWLAAFMAAAAAPAARALPGLPPGADLAFTEHLEGRLAAALDEAPDTIGPDLWLALEQRFGWADDAHPVWRGHPWLLAARDDAREQRLARGRWPAFLASRGIVLPPAADPARHAIADPYGPAHFRPGLAVGGAPTAWRWLDPRFGAAGRPGAWRRLCAYNSRLADAVAELLAVGRELAPGFWEARAAPATLRYWAARSQRHRGLGFSGLLAWLVLFLIPTLVLPPVVLGAQPGRAAVAGALLAGLAGLAASALALEGLARLRWWGLGQARRLGAAIVPWRQRLGAWQHAATVASLGAAAGAVPAAGTPLWPALAALAGGLAWVGLGLPGLSVLCLLGVCGIGVDLALLDWLARAAPAHPAGAWLPLVVVAGRWLLWQALTRLPPVLLARLPATARPRGGWPVLLVAGLWFFALPLGLRHALGLPPLSPAAGAPVALPLPPAPPRGPPAAGGVAPRLPPLQET